MDKLDWTLIRSFLAVVEAGSLSAAARVVGVSQPTLGRHIAQIEAGLAAPLFTKGPRGVVLTALGQALVPQARAMGEAAARLALVAAARGEGLTGTVRLTASRIVATHLLPPMLAGLRQTDPGIEIELEATDSSADLMHRQADIALRMYRPTQLDVVTRQIASLPMAVYAARGLLDRVGRPRTTEDLLALEFVGFDQSDLMLRLMARLGIDRRREDFPLRCDDQVTHWNLVRAGCGVGATLCLIGDADPLVERCAAFVSLPDLPVWLATPGPLRHTPRIRRVMDHLAAGFAALAGPDGPRA